MCTFGKNVWVKLAQVSLMQLLVPEVDLPAVPAVLDRVALRPSCQGNGLFCLAIYTERE